MASPIALPSPVARSHRQSSSADSSILIPQTTSEQLQKHQLPQQHLSPNMAGMCDLTSTAQSSKPASVFDGPTAVPTRAQSFTSLYGSSSSAPFSPTSNSPSSSTEADLKKPVSRPEAPYHVFSSSKKKQLVYIVSVAGLFSSLSSNIYFPALNQISQYLRVDISLIALTITIYMAVQGIAPSFWGPISDTKGRRITFIGTFIVYLAANVGLAFSESFPLLMVFRGLQAAGSSATISIGAGVIGDMTTSRERGGYIGIFGGIRMMGQGVGPVLGGIIAQFLGWHAIFWFLFGLGGLTLLIIIVFLPETLRSIAGNGTTPLHGINKSLVDPTRAPASEHEYSAPEPAKHVTLASIFGPLKFLLEKDVFITLFFGAVVYTVWSTITSTTTASFEARFHLNDLQLGLIFLPNGAGCIAGSYLTGMLMDRDFKVVEKEFRAANNIPDGVDLKVKNYPDFPIEKARLKNIWWIVLIFIVSTALYGFSLNLRILALPLVLQFFIAYTATAVFSLNSALVIDLFPGASASATAVNNLIRCSLGAVGVGVVDLPVAALGEGRTFAIFAGVVTACCGLVVWASVKGEQWRGERTERVRRKEAAEAEKEKAMGVEKDVEKGGVKGEMK